MRLIEFTLLTILLGSVDAHGRDTIPLSSQTLEEIDKEIDWTREYLQNSGYPPEQLDKFLSRKRKWKYVQNTYRDKDIRSVFPEILESDQYLYHCYIGLSEPQEHTIAYASAPQTDTKVQIKFLDCLLEENDGLNCTIEYEEKYYFQDPKNYFELHDLVSLDEALEIISLYNRDKHFRKISELGSIEKDMEWYILRFYRKGCACEDSIKVKLEGDAQSRVLAFDGIWKSGCA